MPGARHHADFHYSIPRLSEGLSLDRPAHLQTSLVSMIGKVARSLKDSELVFGELKQSTSIAYLFIAKYVRYLFNESATAIRIGIVWHLRLIVSE